jgi:hypothetical protein
MAGLLFSKKENVMNKTLALTLLTLSTTSFAEVVPVDLASWTADSYVLGGQPAGNWVVAGDNNSVTQTVNADPSLFRNNINQTSYSIDGSWKSGGGDDDFIGFVFGYQNDHQYYVMDWKATTQSYAGIANEGFRILKIDAASRSDLVLTDFWGSNTGNSSILESSYGSDKGWVANKNYDFHLDFFTNPGEIAVQVKDGATTLWNVVVNDLTFTSGEFGFYNFSQAAVQYSGFEQTGGTVVGAVPIPAAAFLFAPALLGFMGLRRKTKNTMV